MSLLSSLTRRQCQTQSCLGGEVHTRGQHHQSNIITEYVTAILTRETYYCTQNRTFWLVFDYYEHSVGVWLQDINKYSKNTNIYVRKITKLKIYVKY